MPNKAGSILSYKVPIIMDEGDCTTLECMGEFNAEQYLPFLLDEDKTDLLFAMDKLMEELIGLEKIDWCGIYMSIPAQDHNELYTAALLKICYRGACSRGLFPLTEEFAHKSNNSTVGMTGKAVIVNNVHEYVNSGGVYYECDDKVKSEYCLPMFDQAGNIIGIVDIESFSKETFSDTDLMTNLKDLLSRIEAHLRAFVAEI